MFNEPQDAINKSKVHKTPQNTNNHLKAAS